MKGLWGGVEWNYTGRKKGGRCGELFFVKTGTKVSEVMGEVHPVSFWKDTLRTGGQSGAANGRCLGKACGNQ